MTTCNVLRCDQPGRHPFDAGTGETGPMEAALCDEHWTAVDGGDRWVYQFAEEHSTGRMLMGQDLPPRLTDEAEVRGGLLSSDGLTRFATFVVAAPDGTLRDCKVELPSSTVRMLHRLRE